jgi:MFS family permease
MRRNLFLLNANHLVLRTLIQGLLPIYPVYIKELHANTSQVGLALGCTYVMMLVGTWLTGKIMPKYILPKQMILLTTIPIVLCMAGLGLVDEWYQLLPVDMMLLFFTGLNFTTANILTGYYSDASKVGKNYAAISTSSLLGTVIGGFFIGYVLYECGYKYGFMILAALILLSGLFAFFLQEVKVEAKEVKAAPPRMMRGWFLYLLISTFFGGLVMFAAKFAFSLELKGFGYNIKEISNFSAFGTLFTIVVPLIMSRWLKKDNAFIFLFATCLCLLTGVILMAVQIDSWGIIIASVALLSVFAYSSKIPTSQLIYSNFDRRDLAKGQSLIGSANWLSGIAGFWGIGVLMDNTNFTIACVVLMALAVVSFSLAYFAKISNEKSNAVVAI